VCSFYSLFTCSIIFQTENPDPRNFAENAVAKSKKVITARCKSFFSAKIPTEKQHQKCWRRAGRSRSCITVSKRMSTKKFTHTIGDEYKKKHLCLFEKAFSALLSFSDRRTELSRELRCVFWMMASMSSSCSSDVLVINGPYIGRNLRNLSSNLSPFLTA